MRLIHPIYLDVPMLVSFAAAIQGGVSLESEITKEHETTKTGSVGFTGKTGLSNLFSNLFSLDAEAEASGSAIGKNQETRRESRSHTEASLAILLYEQLRAEKYLIKPQDVESTLDMSPGELVELAGTLRKNAVDAMIDYVDAVGILSSLADSPTSQKTQSAKQPPGKKLPDPKKTELEQLRDALDRDRKRTPVTSVTLRCTAPEGLNAVVTLRTASLRDLTLTELHNNGVQVVGKVTRFVPSGSSISSFENYGMALIQPEILAALFHQISTSPDVTASFGDVEIKGPAVQLLPLMIFV